MLKFFLINTGWFLLALAGVILPFGVLSCTMLLLTKIGVPDLGVLLGIVLFFPAAVCGYMIYEAAAAEFVC